MSDRLIDCIPECPGVFAGLPVVYEASWSDYEESGYVVVFDFFGELHCLEGGYSVMSESNAFVFDPYLITQEQLEEIKVEWDRRGY